MMHGLKMGYDIIQNKVFFKNVLDVFTCKTFLLESSRQLVKHFFYFIPIYVLSSSHLQLCRTCFNKFFKCFWHKTFLCRCFGCDVTCKINHIIFAFFFCFTCNCVVIIATRDLDTYCSIQCQNYIFWLMFKIFQMCVFWRLWLLIWQFYVRALKVCCVDFVNLPLFQGPERATCYSTCDVWFCFGQLWAFLKLTEIVWRYDASEWLKQNCWQVTVRFLLSRVCIYWG